MTDCPTAADISVVIPTYCREQVLVDTVEALLQQDDPAGEIILVDQSPQHEPTVANCLEKWSREGDVSWLRLTEPSIPRAMNQGLLAAQKSIVLFLDDDIIPDRKLVACHAVNYRDESICAVVGQILQPGEVVMRGLAPNRGSGIWRDLDFSFSSSHPAYLANCMAGNLSVRRDVAIETGGMDENFVGVAYRFETEFARRLVLHTGRKIRFDPAASLKHLQTGTGGTRSKGHHLASCSPIHSVGDYYFALRQGRGLEKWAYILYRCFRSVRTKFHLRHPWWIPAKLIGEVGGFVWALRLAAGPPKYLAQRDGCALQQ